LVQHEKLQNESVVRLETFMKNVVGGKPVIIVLNLTVLEQVAASGRIGQPQEYIPAAAAAAAAGAGAMPRQQPLYGGHPAAAAAAASVTPEPFYNSTNYAGGGGGGVAGEGGSSSLSSPPRTTAGAPKPPTHGSPSNPYARPSSAGSSGSNHQQQQHYQQHQPIVRDHHMNQPIITHISNLNMYNNRWTIKARVTSKSDIKTWSNAKGEGTLFSIELLDAGGMDIRATFFREAVEKFYPLLQVGKVYRLSGGKLKVANMQWNTCKSQYEITFDQNAEIHLDDDAGDIRAQNYNFVKLAQLESIPEKTTVDVLGIVKAVGDVVSLVSKKTGQELLKCDCTLVDDSGVEVAVTLWGERARKEAANLAGSPVVAFRRARVSDYGGKTLSAGDGVDIDPPNVPEAAALRAWWQANGSSAGFVTRSLSAGMSGGGGRMDSLADRKTVGSIKEEGLGHGGGSGMMMGDGQGSKADWLTFKATVMFIKKDREGGSWYTACPNAGEPCKNRFKVSQTTDMQYYCEKCQQTYDKCVRRWIFSASVEDDTASTWVNVFNEQAEQLLGATADDVYAQTFEGGQDQDAYDSYFARACFSDWLFKCRVNNEMVNDEMRVKTTVHSMVPVDYAKESRDLLAEIAKF
jgi:replication factor A1